MRYVAFIRAINVAGHATVRMNELKAAFAAAGCEDVRSYIQSGNIVFQTSEKKPAALFQDVRLRICDLVGAEPEVCFRTIPELERIVDSAPLRNYEAEPGVKLYVAFLARRPRRTPSFPLLSPKEALEAVALDNLEAFIVSRRKPSGFYGFPNNFIEKELGVPATTRNWSTVTKVAAFAARPRGG